MNQETSTRPKLRARIGGTSRFANGIDASMRAFDFLELEDISHTI